MAKVFRAWDVDQGWLLPPSVHEFVPPGHLAHFVRDTVREALDLSAILETYTEERGFPPYHPGNSFTPGLSVGSVGVCSQQTICDLVHKYRLTIQSEPIAYEPFKPNSGRFHVCQGL